ncbi:MAG: DUF2784 domain-containing protein [Phycicoccus sp.]
MGGLMWFRLVADAAMVAHFAFLAYLVAGGFVAWRWPWTIWPHTAAALYGFLNVLVGWPCPLTDLENWGRARAGDSTLPGTGFIDHYIAGVVYPQEHETLVQVLVAVVVLASWAGFVIRRRREAQH